MSYVNFKRNLSRSQIEALHNASDGKIYFATDGGIYVGNDSGSADMKAVAMTGANKLSVISEDDYDALESGSLVDPNTLYFVY